MKEVDAGNRHLNKTMVWKPSRTFWIVDGFLLGVALLYSGYKAATRVMPLPVKQTRQVISAAEQTRIYYRQYSEGYIRLSHETWRYDAASRTAYHALLQHEPNEQRRVDRGQADSDLSSISPDAFSLRARTYGFIS
jgi:hypothetical protein